MEKILENKKIINVIIFIAFIVSSFVLAQKHEFWADEAQSWLIARDNTIIEIMGMTKYEGTPCLWTMILKIFIKFGLKYEYFYIIPLFFSSFGIFIMLFKLKIPQILKILLPFTYFIMYQYTIVARSYCLILPVLSLIALYYDKKEEKILLYSNLLMILMGISAHTYLMSVYLFCDLIYSLYKKYKFKLNKRMIVAIIVLCIFYMITFIMVIPNENYISNINKGKGLIEVFSNALFSSNLYLNIIDIFLCVIVCILFFKNIELKNKIFLLLFLVSPLIIMVLIRAEVWHMGIFFLSFLFFCIITGDIKKRNLKYMIMLICLISIFWNTENCYIDYINVVSQNELIVDYLKEIDAPNRIVYGIGYNVIEFNPYFEKNIYDNFKSEKGYYKWNKDNNYMSNEEMLKNLPEIFVCHSNFNYLIPEEYTEKIFEAKIYVKGKEYLDNTIYIYEKVN